MNIGKASCMNVLYFKFLSVDILNSNDAKPEKIPTTKRFLEDYHQFMARAIDG
jgi:hypothetical protein